MFVVSRANGFCLGGLGTGKEIGDSEQDSEQAIIY